MSPERMERKPAEFRRFESAREAREAARDALAESIRLSPGPVLLLISGGSSLDVLADLPDDVLGPWLTISTLDERCSVFADVNTFSKFKTKSPLYARAIKAGVHFIGTYVESMEETPQELAMRTEIQWKEWAHSARIDQKEEKGRGTIIALQGIGADGHTAGILPDPDNPIGFKAALEDPDRWMFGYVAKENEFPERSTATISFLVNQVRRAIVYVVGPEKQPALNQIEGRTDSLEKMPGRVVNCMEDATIFTSASKT